jgi:demethylmenaquinone methyltransferase/2-methoxy-6-polyprenyl-1,4-benzoquinol methylase
MTTTDHEYHVTRKYKRLSLYYDPLFSTLERIVFSGENKNPRQALSMKIPTGRLSVLDVCTGTGRGVLPIAASGADIVAIDLSPHMLAVADRKIRNQKIQNISLHKMDATKLDLPDERFDVAISSFALHEMDRTLIDQVLKEIHRVLKTGGKLYLVEFEKDKNPWIQFLFNLYTRISYPPTVQQFFRYDWREILPPTGFHLDNIERYRISKLICATKNS